MNMIIFLLAIISFSLSQETIVSTKYGKVRGKIQELNGAKYTVFRGIPYAAPPTGDLRWQPPQRHAGWGDSILDAIEIGPACPQLFNTKWERSDFPPRLFDQISDKEKQNEDCLLLDIYVTGDLSRDQNASFPVIVFIHGGFLITGSSVYETGAAFVTQAEPVVMVAIQYRLGILGFFTSGDDTLSGNFGLKDQTFALKWVQENIAAFGGNPDQVTITGQSAGARSVFSHMISPMSAGLFHKASIQSAVTSWLFPQKAALRNYFIDYAESLGCEGPSKEAVACLKDKPWEDLFNVSVKQMFPLFTRFIDGEFFTDDPQYLLENGKFNDADLIVGFTSEDGKFYLDRLIPDYDFTSDRSRDEEILNVSVTFMLKTHLEDLHSPFDFDSPIKRYGKSLTNREQLYTMIKARYYDAQENKLRKARGILDANNDAMVTAGSMWVANQVARRGGRVFVYSFNHVTSVLEQDVPDGLKLGVPHSGELSYQFGYGMTDPDFLKLTNEELALSRSVIHAWTSFAAGDASYLTMNGEKIEWPRYTLEEKNVLYFDTNMSPESGNADTDWQSVVDFWLALHSQADWSETQASRQKQARRNKDDL